MSDEGQFNHQDLVDFAENEQGQNQPFGEPILPQAPRATNEDFIVVNGEKGVSGTSDVQEGMNKMVYDMANAVQDALKTDKVVAEADSSSSTAHQRKPTPAAQEPVPQTKPDSKSKKEQSSDSCAVCPYYMLSCDFISKIQIPPYLRNLLLWKDPKFTGAVFGTQLVLLISLASFSFLTVIGSLMLLALTSIGAYRFYLAFMFRIKGIPDETFEKLSNYDLSLPQEKVRQITILIEQDINKLLNKAKSIILWDNIYISTIAYVIFYVVYCVGSVFNTLTLLTLCLVSAFTLPKAYEIYKVPIDNLLEKATSTVHIGVKQVMKKVPFLNPKKVQ